MYVRFFFFMTFCYQNVCWRVLGFRGLMIRRERTVYQILVDRRFDCSRRKWHPLESSDHLWWCWGTFHDWIGNKPCMVYKLGVWKRASGKIEVFCWSGWRRSVGGGIKVHTLCTCLWRGPVEVKVDDVDIISWFNPLPLAGPSPWHHNVICSSLDCFARFVFQNKQRG